MPKQQPPYMIITAGSLHLLIRKMSPSHSGTYWDFPEYNLVESIIVQYIVDVMYYYKQAYRAEKPVEIPEWVRENEETLPVYCAIIGINENSHIKILKDLGIVL